MAQLVIFYPNPLIGTGSPVQVRIQDMGWCELKSGSYIIRNAAPGNQIIAFSMCGSAVISRAALKVSPGERYYIQVTPYDSSLLGVMSDYPSENVPPNSPPHKEPLEIKRVDEGTALQKLQSLTPAPSVH
jgi:hypothetical protein